MSDIDKLMKLITNLTEGKFYGNLEIKMEAGKIVIIKKTESIKLN